MALQDYSTNITRPAQQNLTGSVTALMIEEFNGRIEEIYMQDSVTEGFFEMPTLTGTNAMSNAGYGDPTIVAVTPGVEPTPGQVEVSKQVVTVDVPIISRVLTPMLETVQDRLDLKGKFPTKQARKIARFKDKVLLHKCVQAALDTNGYGDITGMPSGKRIELGPGETEDATIFLPDIGEIVQYALDNDLEFGDEFRLYVRPAVYIALLQNDKLVSADYSDNNGDFARARLDRAYGLPIIATPRVPTEANAAHVMGTAYNVSDEESDTLILGAAPDAIMSAQAIPLTSNVFWDPITLNWFIDSYTAFGSATNRPDNAGVILKYRA